MKNPSSLFMAFLLLFSCASSKNGSSREAKKMVDQIRPLIGLSAEQARKLTNVEATFLDHVKKLNPKNKNYEKAILTLKEKRTKAFKRIMSREQFIKFQAIEKNWIKKVPVYSED